MRVFAFANGYGQDGYDSSKMSRPFQPKLGSFSDDGFARLDLVVAAAAKNGLRLILPLSNWWDEQGGCQWWVDQVYGRNPKQPRELFFSDPKVRLRGVLSFFPFDLDLEKEKTHSSPFFLPTSNQKQKTGQGRLPGLHLPRHHPQKPQIEWSTLLGGTLHHGLGAHERAPTFQQL